MNKLYYFFALVLIVISISAFGQDEGKWDVIKDTKKIVLPETGRNFEKITIEQPQAPIEPQNYETHDVDLDLPKLSTKINVVKMTPDPLKKLYGNYVKAGFGNYSTPYLEGFFNNKRDEKLAYGLHLKHFSSKNGPVRKDFSGLSQNNADAYLRYITKNSELTGKVLYSRDRYNFYGFNPNLPASRDTLKNIYSNFQISAGAKNLDKTATLLYDLNLDYFNFVNSYRDSGKARENEFLAKLGTRYKIDNEKAFLLDLQLSSSNRKDSSTVKRTLFQIKPAVEYKKDLLKVIAGFNLAYENDTIGKNNLHFYPRVHVDYALVPSTIGVFAGLNGEMQKNTLRTFAEQNFYLASNVPLAHTNKALEFYGGIHGNVNAVNYKAKISYANYKNLYFFNNSFTDTSRFTVLYDKSTTVLNLEGELSYEVSEAFRVGTNLNYFNYNVDTLSAAYHRPNFIGRLSGTYNLHKKIYFNADIYYISGLTGKNFVTNKLHKLDNYADVNLKMDYKFSPVFSAFLELNNLLSKKYQRYLYYPVKGFNVIAGIAYSF